MSKNRDWESGFGCGILFGCIILCAYRLLVWMFP